jgi:hypothetical protein
MTIKQLIVTGLIVAAIAFAAVVIGVQFLPPAV